METHIKSSKKKVSLSKKIVNKIINRDTLSLVIFISVFLVVWQLVYMSEILPKLSLPSPLAVGQTIIELLFDFTLVKGTAFTLWRLFLGFLLSLTLGLITGLLMIKFQQFGKTMSSFAVGLQSFPSIAWIPFAILLIGFNDFGILFVVVMSSVFSVMLSTYTGLRNVPPIYIRAARNMGAKGFSLFRYVLIPAATPTLIMGMRQAWSFAWHALIGAEMLITTLVGLGYILSVGREFSNMSQIIATMIVIFTIGLIFDRVVFIKIEEKIRDRWGLNQQKIEQ
ncbi:MAG TPA: ABC transporter permease [Nitrososphaeraceae archaeon]|nr:ABC transporter permease [Nitrososphaeraceae archaeon]HSL14601.1 ABC transporter permease [Nitrososphaeraceae archaeon]